jgi:hypothetical protein
VTKIISKAVIKDSIDRIFEIISNVDTFAEIMKDYICDVRMIKGSSLAEKDAEFSLKFEFFIPVYFKINDCVIDDSFKKLHFTSMEGSAMDCELIHSLYWDSVDKNTLFVKELVLKKNFPIIPEGIDKYKKDQIEIIKRMKHLLKLKTVGLEQEESVRIDCSVEEVWKYLLDLKLFSCILPCKVSEIRCENSQVNKVGAVISIVTNTIEVYLKVKECISNDFYKEFTVEYINPHSPKQLMKICFLQIQEGSTMLSFTNKFLEPVNYKYINELTENKKQVIVNLKKMIENRL